jgi:hypothetical protein
MNQKRNNKQHCYSLLFSYQRAGKGFLGGYQSWHQAGIFTRCYGKEMPDEKLRLRLAYSLPLQICAYSQAEVHEEVQPSDVIIHSITSVTPEQANGLQTTKLFL